MRGPISNARAAPTAGAVETSDGYQEGYEQEEREGLSKGARAGVYLGIAFAGTTIAVSSLLRGSYNEAADAISGAAVSAAVWFGIGKLKQLTALRRRDKDQSETQRPEIA